ncbi:MAG: hypothetical protein AAB566_01485 [Patescibacteria group bacterium]
MENKTKIFWIIVGLSLALIYADNVRLNFGSSQAQTAGLMIYFDQDRKRMFEGPVIDGMTLLDTLAASAAAGNFDFDFALDENGKIKSVVLDGRPGGNQRWQFYLNKKPVANPDLPEIRIRAGDLIEAKLE